MTATHRLSYPIRLPDAAQQDALRLLDISREVINLTVTALWDRLDEFVTRPNTHAYEQVEEMIAPPLPHGHRQWRCEAEQAGRILRGQAERKQQFALIVPLLQRDRFPVGDSRRRPSEDALPVLHREISRCWRKYEARTNDLGHLAANILLDLS